MEHSKSIAEVTIKKASGDTEAFDVGKLKSSLKKAGAAETVINEIVNDIENWVYDGVSTRKIYSRAYKMLRQQNGSGALLYKLKMAINSLGPSGFPFEQFIGELFKVHGYEVKVGQVLEGISITHEMDVIATKGKEHNLIECKFSPNQGKHISIQVPLYVHSRVDDIVEKLHQDPHYKDTTFVAWVVTNARFSSDSIAYSRSKGIHLLGWDYPADNSL
ncbi:MAG: restriction endonuclease, partial [Candidatus Cloacimonadaceae bacterium]|nr:restriction endonuclease [Candidatus Cloacimonadaceae bacterium]